MKKKCLISFVGLSRTFIECSSNIFENLIDVNSDNFEFFLNFNTDLGNEQTNKFSNKSISSIDMIDFENDIWKIYGKYVNKITYLSINDIKNKSGTQIFRERCKYIYDIEFVNNFDIYIFIRFDVKFSKKVNLEDFLPINHKISFITGGNYSTSRQDHTYDWDYCWIGDKESIYKWLTYYSPDNPSRQQIIDTYLKINGFNGQYINRILSGGDLEDHWVNNYWKIFYNLNMFGCEISFESERSGIFLNIIR